MRKTTEERFWEKVDTSGDCWLWTACTRGRDERSRYGAFNLGGGKGRMVNAHDYAWEMVNGPRPEGRLIDHRCRNKLCVRIEHLRLATNKQNQENQSVTSRITQSGFRGVYPHRGKWRALVGHNGKSYFGGSFATPEEAFFAVQALRNRLFTHNDEDRHERSVR